MHYKVFVTHRTHRHTASILFILPMSWCPKQDVQESRSVPPSVLKSPIRQRCFWLVTFFTVASNSSLNYPLFFEGELLVEAYTFTKWTGPIVVLRLRVRILFLTVRPKPYSLVSSGGFPHHKKDWSFFLKSLITEDGSKSQTFMLFMTLVLQTLLISRRLSVSTGVMVPPDVPAFQA